jgi:uncharacterized protein YodC (DUF2158 family)
MSKLKTGDIVQLKSGGPKMTIEEVLPVGNVVKCQWFAGSKLETGLFHPESIKPFEPEEKPKG